MPDGFLLRRTGRFDKWLKGLRDGAATAVINARLTRLKVNGHWGDHATVGKGVIELRIHVGPGYRVYCWRSGATVVIALGGGTKNGQQADIDAAIDMVVQLKEGDRR